VSEGKSDVDVVLKGCIRAEKVDDPAYYIEELLKQAKPLHLKKQYGIEDWEDSEDFLKKVAENKGKLLKVITLLIKPLGRRARLKNFSKNSAYGLVEGRNPLHELST